MTIRGSVTPLFCGKFDRDLNPPHAVSTFEEAEVNERRRYLAMAALLTILTAVVTMYHGGATWKAWSGDIRGGGLLVLFGALGVASLADVWV